LGVLLSQHERHHVDLAQCTVRDYGIVGEAFVFLVIGTVYHRKSVKRVIFLMEQANAPEMLDGSADSAFLKAPYIRGSEDSGQVWVLGERLEALRDGVSLGGWINDGAAALCHRGGSEEMRVRNAVKRR